MYDQIENLYKKESPYNIIKKKTICIYFIGVIIALIFNTFKHHIIAILIVIGVVLLIIRSSEEVLNKKIHLSFNKNEKSLNDFIKDAEKEMFKKYLIKNMMYNEKTLLCILEHYRLFTQPSSVSNNLISILGIVIPIILSFITKDEFDINNFKVALPYVLLTAFIVIVIYYVIKDVNQIKKFFKGEDGMYVRLEEIFSELYVECVNSFNLL